MARPRIASRSSSARENGVRRPAASIPFKQLSNGRFEITGIGQTRSVSGAQAQRSFEFSLVSGSDAVGAGYFFGWKDGSVGPNCPRM